ncbi:Crp/Fnr family transcriptional regulator [Belnapia rosea]|uniref:cAMP-binding domain of CRP or a regulatory subunit of cAMP-dependent protein kinases n=1 Tax=Belnapia rosea TaxID=938405 RepID=A0A1G6R0C1_9PROT|nr:Crp/Fnr family transcriptional regulator [Belnapia rosea]SDC97447.1 cAMP-binding domain of CRP or a regulatory subunit of cAMP-dependent protein kinases [Belnapia rosea]
MAIADQPLPSLRNRLLAALPSGDVAKLWPQLEPVELEFRKTLQRPDEPAGSVYFPEVGYVSRLASMEDGDSAEIGLIGPEGMTGLAVLLGADRDSFELLVQMPGTAMRMDATAFRKALDDIPSLRPLLNRYALAHFEQVARTGACNGRHHIDQRLARWLLMSHDRTGSDEFPMTHEFMSMMLGVRRAGITVAAGSLQKAGLINYRAGKMRIADRPGLEAATCECYGVARRAYDSLIGLPAGTSRPYWR